MDRFIELLDRQADLKARELGEGKPLSNHAITRLTAEVDDEGRGLHVSAIGHYRTGRRSSPSARTVELLARALATGDHPFSELRAELQEAAGLPVGAPGKYVPPDVVNLLERSDQLLVDNLIRRLAALTISADTSRRPVDDEG